MNLFYDQLRGPYQFSKRPSTPNRSYQIRKKPNSLNMTFDATDLAASVLHSRKSESLEPKQLYISRKSALKQSMNKSIRVTMPCMNLQEVVLEDNCKDQPDAVLQHLLRGEQFCKQENEILTKWIYTLPQDVRMEIEVDKKYFPIPRNIDMKSITSGLKQLYGIGKNRRLRPGEEALVMETIRRYLENVYSQPTLITHGVSTILQEIMRLSGLTDLQEY